MKAGDTVIINIPSKLSDEFSNWDYTWKTWIRSIQLKKVILVKESEMVGNYGSLNGWDVKPFDADRFDIACPWVYCEWISASNNTEQKICTCDSRVLFNNGCMCNSITPYRKLARDKGMWFA